MSLTATARIRRATAGDRDAVLAFCQDTFRWGDYIAEVWDDWLADPKGILLVAEVAKTPVAIGHARMMSATEAWLEGLRVHPEHRRRGIADAMNAAGCDWARARGASIARLATETTNEPALRQVARLGFRPLAEFAYWTAGSAVGNPVAEPRTGRVDDLPAVAAAWRSSELAAAGAGLVAVGWAWRDLTEADLASALAAGRVQVVDDGFALLGTEDSETRLMWLGGPSNMWDRLVMAVRQLAAREAQARASALVPSHPALAAALAGGGYTREGSYRIFVKAL